MIAYGRNTVIEGLKSDFKVSELYLEEDIKRDEKIMNIVNLAEKNSIPISYLSHKKLTAITRNDDHQGVGCNISFSESKLKDILESNSSLSNSFIYISEATYEHNIGAIIRTAECAGFGGVILPTNINITAIIAKISTGALFHIPIIKISIFQAIKEFKQYGYNIVGIEREGTSLAENVFIENNLFIIGGEDKSLTEQIRSLCDQIVEIPQFGKVNSLNMSVASSIVIFEYIRQKINLNKF